MRTHLFSSLGALKIGMDILFEQEQVKLDERYKKGLGIERAAVDGLR
jgi:hypothetical protein